MVTATARPDEPAVHVWPKRGYFSFWRAWSRRPLGLAGLLVLCLVILTGTLAPWITPHDPLIHDYSKSLGAPTWTHPFGTDQFGRDILSRVIMGARVSLSIALASLGVSVTLGTALGLLSGFFGGRIDLGIQRLVDVMMSLPALVLALALVSVLGPGIANVIIALSVVYTPLIARVVRGSTLSVREFQFVEAARALGASSRRMLLRHIFPNVTVPIIIIASAALPEAIMLEAALSFLGLGVPAPAASWGNMLSGDTIIRLVYEAPWLVIWPGAALTLTVLGINILGDALRDVLDPRLRR